MTLARCAIVTVVAEMALAMTTSQAADAPRGVDPSALMRRVADSYAQEMRGIVGLRTHTELMVDGPMYHKRTPSTPWYVYVDGRQVRSSESVDARRPLVHDALRTAYLSEYRYVYTDCTGCAPDEIAVAYDSAEHDEYHAHGYFVIDTANERVRRSVEIPYELPWPSRDGRLVVTWGPSGNDWLPAKIYGTFSGKVGPFSGTAHYTQILTPYERFADLDAAVTALTAQTGATPAPEPAPSS